MVKGRVFQVATNHHCVEMALVRWNLTVTGWSIHSSLFNWHSFRPVLTCLPQKTPQPRSGSWISPTLYALNPSGGNGWTKGATAQRIISLYTASTRTELAIIEPLKIFQHFHYKPLFFRGLWFNFKHSLRDKSGIRGLGDIIIFLNERNFLYFASAKQMVLINADLKISRGQSLKK